MLNLLYLDFAGGKPPWSKDLDVEVPSLRTASAWDEAAESLRDWADLLWLRLEGERLAELPQLATCLAASPRLQCLLLTASEDLEREATSRLDPYLSRLEVMRLQRGPIGNVDLRLKACLRRCAAVQALQSDLQRVREIDAARDGLTHKLVHDMKSPLTVILIELGMMERWWEQGKSERFERGLERITQNCEEMIELVQNLLDAGRMRRGSLEMEFLPSSLNSLIREILENPPPLLEKRGVRLNLDLQDADTVVEMDAGIIQKVLNNLLKVASRIAPVQGDVTLHVGRRGDRVRIAFQLPSEGMNEKLASLFEPFAHEDWRALGVDAASGISLNFGRQVVEQHGGSLGLEFLQDGSPCLMAELPTTDQI